jgi:uncharacterized protein (TIGR02466 family)
MNLGYQFLWPVPVGLTHFHRELTKDEYDFIDSAELDQMQSNGISKNVHILDTPELSNLKADLNVYLQQYWNEIFDCEQSLSMTNTWIARSQPGENHHTHEHPNSVVSGVLYVKATDGAGAFKMIHDGPIYDKIDLNYNLRNYNVFNSRSWSFKVKTGDILLFPSSITHGVTVNTDERIILGFNSFPSGDFGGNYISDLKLRTE